MIGHQSLFMNWEILQKSSPFCDYEWQKVSFVSIKRKNFSRVCGAARTLVWHNTPFPCQHHLTVTTANWAGGSRANYFLCLMIHPHLKFKDVSDVKKSFFIVYKFKQLPYIPKDAEFQGLCSHAPISYRFSVPLSPCSGIIYYYH